MRNSSKLGILLLGLTLLVIAVIDLTSDKQVDWTRSYDQKDKIPYGLYVTRQELPQLLPNKSITDFSENNYPDLKSFLRDKEGASLVYVVDYFSQSNELVKELVSFVDRGGEVFISSNTMPSSLLDTMGIEQDYYYAAGSDELLDFTEKPFLLSNGLSAFYKDLNYPGLFYNIDSAETTVLGYFERGKLKLPNFIEVKRNKGRFILHLEPLMFTNYYMLQRANFNYAATAFKLISKDQVYWFNAAATGTVERSPLRFLLSHKGLRQAWYLLLFGLILLLLFKSKREQKAVPIVMPEPNLSKDFAATIATMYYENGTPEDLGIKKIDYFLYDLRTQFQIDTQLLDEPGAAQHLAQRTGVALNFCTELLERIRKHRSNLQLSDRQLLDLNLFIEDFKHKANML